MLHLVFEHKLLCKNTPLNFNIRQNPAIMLQLYGIFSPLKKFHPVALSSEHFLHFYYVQKKDF